MVNDHDDLGPGLHVFQESSPLERAGSLAARLRADLCATLLQADAMVVERQALGAIDVHALDALRSLADRLAMVDRIAERTRDRAVAVVAERMAGAGVGMAVHPSTIRERAQALQQAHTEVAQAEQLLETHDATTRQPEPVTVPVPVQPPVLLEPEPVVVPRKRGLLGFLRRDRAEQTDMTESSNLLRAMSVATDEAFGARRATVLRDDQRTLLVVRRDAALEVVRVAQRAWHDLAGDGVEPGEVEEVVRRLDPQHRDALLIAGETVSVRAASSIFDKAVQRWDTSWADLHLDAPTPGEAMEAVDRLTGQVTKAVVLVGEATERGSAVAEAAPAAPVLVIEGPLEVS